MMMSKALLTIERYFSHNITTQKTFLTITFVLEHSEELLIISKLANFYQLIICNKKWLCNESCG